MITRAASGMGKVAATLFAKEGARVTREYTVTDWELGSFERI